MSKKYYTIKKYGHERGLSCAFRQWGATHSHCSFLHGYSIAVELVFSCTELDSRNWCVDYGDLGEIKDWLEENFDHKTLVAENDPELEWYQEAARKKILDINIVPAVGCEKMSEMIFDFTKSWLEKNNLNSRITLEKVSVWEHDSNSASIVEI